MANILFFLSLLVVLMLIWFDGEKKREKGRKKKRLNRINVVPGNDSRKVCALRNESYELAKETPKKPANESRVQTFGQTFFGGLLDRKAANKIADSKPVMSPPDNRMQKVNRTEIKQQKEAVLIKKEAEQLNDQTKGAGLAKGTDQKANKEPDKSGPKKAPKYSFLLLRLLSRSVWFILKFLYLLLSLTCRLISILSSMRNSFLSKLIVFYLTILAILSVLAICTAVALKEPASLARLGHQIAQMHVQILRTTVNVLKTFLTFLLLFVVVLYPERHKFKFESSNYFNHLKLISTGLTQTVFVYLSKLLGYSILYLTKFEIYFSYLENYIELSFPTNEPQ